jgi:hypothetical protein
MSVRLRGRRNMKYQIRNWAIPSLFFTLATFVSCIPLAVAQPDQQTSVPAWTFFVTDRPIQTFTSSSSSTASETSQPAETFTSTAFPTASGTSPPTRIIRPTAIPATAEPVAPTYTFTVSPTSTKTIQPTETAVPPTVDCPIATQEVFLVEPVASSTDQLSQVITVYIGNGEEVTVVTESGTFTATGILGPYLVEISLLPNTEHHLEVIAKVRQVVGWSGCLYGGYTMTTTIDRYGAPLTIIQGTPVP